MRPTINLDPLRSRIHAAVARDPMLAGVARLAEVAAPRTVARLRELDANLPEILGAAQERAAEVLAREVDRALVRSLDRLAGGAKARTPKRRRLAR